VGQRLELELARGVSRLRRVAARAGTHQATWLGDRRYLEPRRATELADQLTRLSMAPPQLKLVASN